MRNGKFNSQIYDAIEQADDFILIMSKDALARCAEPEDWVRIEIEHALKHNKNIILVSTEPEIIFPDNLPLTLKDLCTYHCMSLNQEYYDESIRKLMGMLSHKSKKSSWSLIINPLWLLILLFIIICIVAICTLYTNHKNNSNSIPKRKAGIIAKLYLPRYADIDREILDTPWFSCLNKSDFNYIDTIIGDDYHIYPHSPYMTDNTKKYLRVIDNPLSYHNLPLRISIHNTKSQTQVFNKGELEIMEIHPISHPFISIYDKTDSLQLISQLPFYQNVYDLSYSLLHRGESFLDYKTNVRISTPEYIISTSSADSIIGEIRDGNKSWKFSYGFKDKSLIDDTKDLSPTRLTSKIMPMSSNVKVFEVSIKSMEAPCDYQLYDLSRYVVKGEVDDDMYVIIQSNFSFNAKVRVKLTTVNDQIIFSEPIYITFIKPQYYENIPF